MSDNNTEEKVDKTSSAIKEDDRLKEEAPLSFPGLPVSVSTSVPLSRLFVFAGKLTFDDWLREGGVGGTATARRTKDAEVSPLESGDGKDKFMSAFSPTDRKDMILMFFGSICSIVGGVGVPLFMYIMGGMYRELATPTNTILGDNATQNYAL